MNEKADVRNWSTLIHTFLGSLNVEYTISTRNGNIVVSAVNSDDAELIRSKLQTILKTPQSFFESLPYSISNMDTKNLDQNELDIKTPILEDSYEQGFNTFQSFFSVETADDIALNLPELFNEKKGAYSENYVLYSKPAKRKHTVEIWKDYLEALLIRLRGKDAAALRKIWMNENQASMQEASDMLDFSDESVIQGLLQHCLGVIETENDLNQKQAILYFNYGLLFRFIFPPAIQDNEKNSLELVIDQEHLLNYIQQLTNGGILLQVYQTSEGVPIARPIFFVSKNIKEVKPTYTMIIDRSGSMRNNFSKLGEKVIQFTQKLREINSEGIIRIVFFNEEASDLKEFPVSSKEIEFYIHQEISKGAFGRTRLFNSVLDQLKMLGGQGVTQDPSVMFVFTDGYDNESGDRDIALEAITQELKQFSLGGASIKIFTMGIGKYDFQALDYFSKETRAPLIHLETMEDFNDIYDYLKTFKYHEKTIELLLKAEGKDHFEKYNVFVLPDGTPQASKIYLPFKESPIEIIKDNYPLAFSLDSQSGLPAARVEDEIDSILAKAYKVLADTPSIEEAIRLVTQLELDLNSLEPLLSISKDLERIESKIENVPVEKGIDMLSQLSLKLKKTEKQSVLLYQEAQSEIKDYLDALDKAKKGNQAIYQSLKSKARVKLGYEKEQEVVFIEDVTSGFSHKRTSKGVGPMGVEAAEISCFPRQNLQSGLSPILDQFELADSKTDQSSESLEHSDFEGHTKSSTQYCFFEQERSVEPTPEGRRYDFHYEIETINPQPTTALCRVDQICNSSGGYCKIDLTLQAEGETLYYSSQNKMIYGLKPGGNHQIKLDGTCGIEQLNMVAEDIKNQLPDYEQAMLLKDIQTKALQITYSMGMSCVTTGVTTLAKDFALTRGYSPKTAQQIGDAVHYTFIGAQVFYDFYQGLNALNALLPLGISNAVGQGSQEMGFSDKTTKIAKVGTYYGTRVVFGGFWQAGANFLTSMASGWIGHKVAEKISEKSLSPLLASKLEQFNEEISKLYCHLNDLEKLGFNLDHIHEELDPKLDGLYQAIAESDKQDLRFYRVLNEWEEWIQKFSEQLDSINFTKPIELDSLGNA